MGNHCVYYLIYRGEIVYIGMTQDPGGREQRHKDDKEFDYMHIVFSNLSEHEALRLEQIELTAYRLKNGGHDPIYNKRL